MFQREKVKQNKGSGGKNVPGTHNNQRNVQAGR